MRPENAFFGLLDVDSGDVLLVVEAQDLEQAVVRMVAAAPYVGLTELTEVHLVPLPFCPAGIPAFLQAFFDDGAVRVTRVQVAPSNRTLH